MVEQDRALEQVEVFMLKSEHHKGSQYVGNNDRPIRCGAIRG